MTRRSLSGATCAPWCLVILAVVLVASLGPLGSLADGAGIAWAQDQPGPERQSAPSETDARHAAGDSRQRSPLRALLLTQSAMDAIKVAVAVAGTLLLLWAQVLRRAGRPAAHQPLRDGLLLALGLFAGMCWWNLFHFHFRNYVHNWDVFHYYVGAKYFPEVGYTRLYRCVVIADAEDGLLFRAERRKVRHLESNTLGGTQAILADPERCKAHFSEARWALFKHDIAWFRGRMPPAFWEQAQRDHGYNGTPAWGILGSTLAGLGPASSTQILLLALLDPLLLLLMWAAVGWAFGWRVMCVALLYWGTNYPARFFWNGGAYLRQDWLAISIIGICMLRRQRMAAGGFALTAAALLRVFPGLIIVGVLLKALMKMWSERTLTPSPGHRRFALGCVAALALLVTASAVVAGSWTAWSGFIDNSRKHADTPLTNHMGLKTVVAYDHDTRARLSAPLGLEEDPFLVWKEARRRVFEERVYLFAGLVLGFLILLARAVKNEEDWVAAVLAVGLVPVATELTCYYYSVFLAFGFLWARRESIGVGLCALAALTCLIATLFDWNDEQYTAMSVATLAFVAFATAAFVRSPVPSPEQAPSVSPAK
jgi:hypothetical protein